MPRLSRAPRTGRVLAAASVLTAATALLPPVGSEARHYLWVEGLQFVLLALVLPAFTTLSLPARWRLLRPGWGWMSSAAALEIAATASWRLTPAVDGLARHPWLVVVEGLCLLVAGLGVWSFLLSEPPASGVSSSYPWRMAVAAMVMWSIWVFAYLVGLSHATWYPVYARMSGLSTNADQQLATGVLWAGAGLTFGPVIFWCLWQWLAPERVGPL